jgi:hypothetical protein
MAKQRILGYDKVAFVIEAQDLETRVDPGGVVEEIKKVPPRGPPKPPGGGGGGPRLPQEIFFQDIQINQQFLYEGKTYKKIGPTKARERSGEPGHPRERPFKPDDIVYIL